MVHINSLRQVICCRSIERISKYPRRCRFAFTAASSHIEPYLPYMRFASSSSDNSEKSGEHHHALYKKQLRDLQEEREALFGFTAADKESWTSQDIGENSATGDNSLKSLDEVVGRLKEAKHLSKSYGESSIVESFNDGNDKTFTHLSISRDSASMVDVGHKISTRRIARAQTKVIFPVEVMEAFRTRNEKELQSTSSSEIVGPKGPIFSTAKLAGIMGAKRTSDLIPLCHPLPLERVHIDINLEENLQDGTATAIVECECRVTHKTGAFLNVRPFLWARDFVIGACGLICAFRC